MDSLRKSVATITAYSAVTRMLGFGFRIFLASQIGATMLGVYQVSFSFFIVLLGLTASGVPLAVSAFTAKNPLDVRHGGGIASSALILSFALCVLVIGGVLVLKKPISHLFADPRSWGVLLMLLPALVFSALSAPFRGSVWGRKYYTACSVIELIEQIARIVLTVLLFLCFNLGLDKARLAALALSIGCGISGIGYVLAYFRDGFSLRRPTDLKPLFVTAVPISVSHLASNISSLLIALIVPLRLMAGGMDSFTALGLYGESVGMALGFLFVPLTLTGSLSMALVPELSRSMEGSSCRNLRDLCSKGLRFACLAAGLFFPLFSSLGIPVGLVFYGSYRSGVFLSQAAFLMIPIALEQIASSMMNSLGLEKKAFLNFFLGTVLLLVILWFATPALGVNALILGMTAQYLAACILHIIAMRERISLPLDFLRTTSKVFLAAIPGILAGYFLYPLLLCVGVQFSLLASGTVVFILTLAMYRVLGLGSFKMLGLTFKRIKAKRQTNC